MYVGIEHIGTITWNVLAAAPCLVIETNEHDASEKHTQPRPHHKQTIFVWIVIF